MVPRRCGKFNFKGGTIIWKIHRKNEFVDHQYYRTREEVIKETADDIWKSSITGRDAGNEGQSSRSMDVANIPLNTARHIISSAIFDPQFLLTKTGLPVT
jgi:hypothetical protein